MTRLSAEPAPGPVDERGRTALFHALRPQVRPADPPEEEKPRRWRRRSTDGAAAGPTTRRRPLVRFGPVLLLLIYLAVLAAVTLGPGDAETARGAGAQDNFVPFHEIRRSLDDGSIVQLLQVLGNALIFVPFGVLMPHAFPRMRIVSAVLIAAAASACVELVQLTHLAGRMFDIDDVMLNVAGALLGGLLLAVWRGVAALVRMIRR